MRTESNPFRSSYNNQGNTLNEPVAFLAESPLGQNQNQQDRSHINYSNNPNSKCQYTQGPTLATTRW